MKVAVKQGGPQQPASGPSMPNLLGDDVELDPPPQQQDQEADAGDGEEDDGERPATIPTQVTCLVPGCGKKHGRMCTFPTGGNMRTAWVSVLNAVFPSLDTNAPEPKLKLLCEEHFDKSDFDQRGMIKPDAVPTKFPGGVKVVYDSGAKTDKEKTPSKAATTPTSSKEATISCCVPGCSVKAPSEQMYPFPIDLHRAWVSIISAATGRTDWKKGAMEPRTSRPLDLRVCKDHFQPESFQQQTGTKTPMLKPGSHPTLFDGGKKKVLLKPTPTAKADKEKAKSSPSTQRKVLNPAKQTPAAAGAKKLPGPVYVNVTDDGLLLTLKNGQQVGLEELTLSELRRISSCIKDRLRTDPSEEERRKLITSQSQLEPVLEAREQKEAADMGNTPILADLEQLGLDLHEPDVRRLVDAIKDVDKQRRQHERTLSKYFEESDNHAREMESYVAKINACKRKVGQLETTYMRHFKYNDQRSALLGATSIRWSLPTLTLARDIIQKVGKTAYGRLLRMGFPLPSAEVVTSSMEQAQMSGVEWGLVEVVEEKVMEDVEYPTDTETQDKETTTADVSMRSEPSPAKKARTESSPAASEVTAAPEAAAPASDPNAAVQKITAEQIQEVLAGRGTLQDKKGRIISISLADVPGAPAGTKTVVMETPEDAEDIHFVPNATQ